ncbi:hypothetical protein [Aquabacterium sp.]|uniref:hypothetical protein n=1 Tax=Aquabacterium sp. TaxID=1872578 RepID=UPI0025B7CB90|nr:hypothetical protein [Aquabacterium sp.]
MVDKLVQLGDGVSLQRLKDMGDGTFAPVVSASSGGASKVVVTGEYVFGKTLTAKPAPGWAWTAGKWLRNGVDISGATALTYTQGQADIGADITFAPTSPIEVSAAGKTSADKPGAPTIGTATAAGQTISVPFTAPSSDGGSAITGYKVTLSGGDMATGTASPISIGSQPIGVAQTAVVQALNAIGYGPSSAQSNLVTPKYASLRQVASRSQVSNTKIGNPQADGHSYHQAFDNLTTLKLGWINAFGQLEDTTGLATQSYKSFVEYPIGSGSGAYITYNSGASTTGTAAPGTILLSDLTSLGFTIPKYAFFRIRTWVSSASGVVVSRGSAVPASGTSVYDRIVTSGSTSPSIDHTGSDATTYNALATDMNSATYCIKPAAILSVSTVDSFALLGDSRAASETSDITSDSLCLSEHLERIIGAAYPFMNLAAAGEKGFDWTPSGTHGTLRKQLLEYATHVLYGYGTNDFNNAASDAIMNGYPAQVKTVPGVAGKPFWGVTIPPYLSGVPSNKFLTLAGQTLSTNESRRVQYNAFVLANTGNGMLFDRSFDVAPHYTDSSSGSEKWRIYANARTVTGDVDATTGIITLTSGTFTSADTGHRVYNANWAFTASGSGASFVDASTSPYLQYIDSTHAQLITFLGATKKPTASLTAQTFSIGVYDETTDGIHGGQRPAVRMQAALQVPQFQ